jgi:hypothetical protein
VVVGFYLAEAEMVRDPIVRRACAEEGLALLFIRAGLGAVRVPELLDQAARATGYDELKSAPLIFAGHSAGGPQAQRCTVEMAERAVALLQYRGGVPSAEAPIPPGIPALAMMAQFDEFWGEMRRADGTESWQRAVRYLAGFRAADARHLGSIVVEPGAGHFGWSRRNADYAALFIRKAARARIPRGGPEPAGRLPDLLSIAPESGWLTGLELDRDPECAPFADYRGDRAATSWHFDEEMARATLAYHRGLRGKKDQFIRWEDPHWVDAGVRHFFTQITWVDDGRTFQTHPVYADSYPVSKDGQGPRWALAGQPAGHAKVPILVRPVAGPIEAAGGTKLRLHHDALWPAGEHSRPTFLAYSEGDEEYRYTECVGMLPRGFRGLTEGQTQTIEFQAPSVLRPDSAPVPLEAVSDAGLPVEFYVAYGPARIENGRLVVAEIPRRARFPIEIKVVAYQVGRALDPKVRAATPVERVIRLDPR